MTASVNELTMMVVDSTQGDDNFQHNNKVFDEKNSSDDDPNSPSEPLGIDGEAQEGSDSEGSSKKKRRRRVKGGKHHRPRRWKPYNKLSYNERRELDERETARANQKREEAFAHGHPVAPYNTTQFLMEDHIKNESISPDLKDDGEYRLLQFQPSPEKDGSTDSSEDTYSSEEEVEADNFMEKEFSETYNNIHAERLQMMSKDELIKDYLEMEAKLERLQKRLKKGRTSKEGDSSGSLSSGGEEFMDLVASKKFEDENKSLKEENERLKREIEMYNNVK